MNYMPTMETAMARVTKGRDARSNDTKRLVRIARTGTFEHDYRVVGKPDAPMSFPLGRTWFVLTVDDNSQGSVCEDLKYLCYETFNPQRTQRRIKAGRKIDEVRPVFGGYLFVKFDRDRDDWGGISSLEGVRGILSSCEGIPVQIPDGIMRQLIDWDSTGYFDASNKLQPGEEVEITSGPLQGLFAKVKSAKARKRGKVVLEYLLGAVEIDTAFLRRA